MSLKFEKQIKKYFIMNSDTEHIIITG